MKNLLIKSNANIKNTLKQLSKTGEKCLVVVDNRNKILGTISDGDVRKALLKGKVYKDKINEFYQKDPIFLKKDNYSLSQAKNILIKKRIDIIPIIGKSRTVVLFQLSPLSVDFRIKVSSHSPKYAIQIVSPFAFIT